MKLRALAIALALSAAVGCESPPPTKADPVDVAGTVTHNGKPVGGLNISFLPTTGMQSQGYAVLKADGKFRLKLVPGTYTFIFEGGPTALKAVPASYHSNNLNHTVEVPSAGATALDVNVAG